MPITLKKPDIAELKPRITVFGVGGGGGNAVNNMIAAGLKGVDFVVANTDAQALMSSKSERIIQLGASVTEGLGAGSHPEVGKAAAEECLDEIRDHLSNTHMCFVTAGMGGGTGTGSSPVVAKVAREQGILTVGVVTKPFHFEGPRRMKAAEAGIEELQKYVDTLIVIPNQNLFRVANEKTTFAHAFSMADQVLYSGVACITDLMVKEGLINLDFADVKSVMHQMGKAMMGTGEASGEDRAVKAAEAAISNPLLDETSMKGAKGLLVSITGGNDITLFEVDQAATRIREEVDPDANIIVGATHEDSLDGTIKVSVVATGIDNSDSIDDEQNYNDREKVSNFSTVNTKIINEPIKHITADKEITDKDANLEIQLEKNVVSNNLVDEFDKKTEESNILDNKLENYSRFSQKINQDIIDKNSETLYDNLVEQSVNQDTTVGIMRAETTAKAQAFQYNKDDTPQDNTSMNTQIQVKTLVQERLNRHEYPDIIDSYKQDIDDYNFTEREEATPRGLWQKITHSLRGGRKATDGLAKLEPADEIYQNNNKSDYNIDYNRNFNQQTRKKNEFDPEQQEQLEIPAFLRQQGNK